VHSLSTFGARTSHGQIWTHKTHHGPDLEEATTFPLIVYSMVAREAHIQMDFYLEIANIGIPTTLGPLNFACRPLIEMRSKAKLYPSSRAFQRYVACHLHVKKSGQFLTFNGWESNCQFDSRPFFSP